MKYFTIDAQNNITAHSNRKAARETGFGVFSSVEQFADLIGPDHQRLLDIWNSLPGVKPVTKFENRKKATERIWKVIQNLGGSTFRGPQTAPAMAVAQPPQPEPAPETIATGGPSMEAAKRQFESGPAAADEAQESGVAPVEAAQPATPFDEPVANVGAPVADVALSTPAATQKATRTKKARTGEAQGHARGQQNRSGDRHDEAPWRRHPDATHECVWMAGAHRPRFHGRRDEEGWIHGRVL